MGTYFQLIKNRGFTAFLITQFLGAFNDNFYKMVVLLFAKELGEAAGHGGAYTSAVGALFVLPFFLFSGYAGFFSDKFSKHRVLQISKSSEILAMGIGLWAFMSGNIEFMLLVVFLMALQSTFFSPAKYAILPEMLPVRDLSRANGLLEMSTFLAIILGMAGGTFAFSNLHDELSIVGWITLGIAIAGTLCSLAITSVPPSGTTRAFRINPWAEVWDGTVKLFRDTPLWLTSLGIAWFWFIGAILQLLLLDFGYEFLALAPDDTQMGLLLAYLSLGIGIGSMVAGRLSGDKVEPGLMPIGSIGMAVGLGSLALSAGSYVGCAISLGVLGFFAGFFIVPLMALLQHRAESEEKGVLIATTNFIQNGGMLIAAGLHWYLITKLGLLADVVFLGLTLATLLVTHYLVRRLPDFLIRFTFWMLSHTVYKIDIRGQENVPSKGPALLVANHVSFVDGILISACIQRFVRFLAWAQLWKLKVVGPFLRFVKAIPVEGGKPELIKEATERVREQLKNGHVVALFAEGTITRTGNMVRFRKGFEHMADGLDIPIIPVHLDQVWGSIFSFFGGKFMFKWPRKLPYPVRITFGEPMPATAKAHEVRAAVMNMGADAAIDRKCKTEMLHSQFLRTARQQWKKLCLADSSGKELTYGQALIGSRLLAKKIAALAEVDEKVGILLPPSVGGTLANTACTFAGCVPVNLNWTAGPESTQSAIDQCEIKTVISSRTFAEKAEIELPENTVYLEDMAGAGGLAKLCTALAAKFLPQPLLRAMWFRGPSDPDRLATIIFSSGSTGEPKGVMLSHFNILSNVRSITQVLWLREEDRIIGVLPFFHSFGFTGTIWLPLTHGFAAAFHPNPMDSAAIGELAEKYRGSLMISTPTFYLSYLRRVKPEHFAHLRYALAGAEKLRPSIAKKFKERFNVDLLEGYGATEMAPVVSVNIPDFKGDVEQLGTVEGSVGHPLPGIAARVVDIDSGEPKPPNEEGLLLVKGPNLMQGYIGKPELTAEKIQDGWYVTGDVARMDEDGFITLTDRLSRFSKIGGEMVPHLKVETAVGELIPGEKCAVTAIPDDKKGEALVVLYTGTAVGEELWEKLKESDLPNLWIPKKDLFFNIDDLPLLGSGKLDLRTLKTMAHELSNS